MTSARSLSPISARLSADVAGEAILSVDIAGPAATGPLFEALSEAFPGGYRLIHGGVDHIQEQAVGRFFLAVPAEKAAALASHAERLGAQVEVLGHVADHV